MKILSEMCPDYFELVCPDIILRVVRICPVYFERCCIYGKTIRIDILFEFYVYVYDLYCTKSIIRRLTSLT